MDSKQPDVVECEAEVVVALPALPDLIATLPAKGACWYCDKPLDAVRRFCCKSCCVAYAEEAQYHR
ncbi:hypothetical protein [Janthinobacterium sp. UMAB-56]|uniref:hypothetical protein n=1 Tax=Janthinobacterium sp. UMAB-56 TaxID=1365361 RepID=UPI001C55EC6D|nr:hypothetical protein [Janthinobacterium sp. UMAB-56]